MLHGVKFLLKRLFLLDLQKHPMVRALAIQPQIQG